MTQRHSIIAVLAAGAVLVAGACQSAPSTPPGSSTVGATPGPVASSGVPSGSPSASEAAGSSAQPGALEIGSGPFFLADPRAGLDAIAAYEETLTITFSGTVDGTPREWSTTHRFRHASTPGMSVLTIEAGAGAPAEDPVLVAEGAGAELEERADGTCTGRRLDPARSRLAQLEAAAELPGLMGAEDAGSETLDGVATHHYRFDQRAILEAAGPTTTGEIWVASTGGAVRKYLRTTTADAAYFGAGMAGTMTWTYGLRELDPTARIALPAACQLDVPIMTGATDVLVLPAYAGFVTTATLAQVVAFYKAQLPHAGWAYASTPSLTGDQAVLEFHAGTQVLNVLVTSSATGRRVDLALVRHG